MSGIAGNETNVSVKGMREEKRHSEKKAAVNRDSGIVAGVNDAGFGEVEETREEKVNPFFIPGW